MAEGIGAKEATQPEGAFACSEGKKDMDHLIIGGSKGIGRALAAELLAQGHRVFCGSREREGTPEGATWFRFDALTDNLPEEVTAATLHGVAYCPGSMVLKPFRSLSADQFRSDMELHVLGAVRVLQAVQPALQRSGGASVLLFSTVAVGQGMPFHATIAAAKGAVEGLTRSLAAEWAPTIRVNAIAPALTDTPLAGKLLSSPEKMEAAGKRHPLQRVGRPEDIASLGAFLLDSRNSWITGQVIGVDGGMSAVRS